MKKIFQVTATPDHGSLFLEFPGTTEWVTTATDIANIQVMGKEILHEATGTPIDHIELVVTFNDFQVCETEEFKEYDREHGTVHSCEFVKHLV
jgi:hypothetical protein